MFHTARSPELRNCKHCQAAFSNSISTEFCCKGCEAVYQILSNDGLGEYYKLKEGAACLTAPRPVSTLKQEFHFSSASHQVKFYIEGIHCSACLWLLEKLPSVVPDAVNAVSLNLQTSVLSVELTDKARINVVAAKIKEWGYQPHLISDDKEADSRTERENRKRLLEVGVAGALAGNVMLMSIPLYSGASGSSETLFEWLSFSLSVPALFYSGRSFFKNVYSGIRSKTFPIDGPILLALLVAFFYSTVSLIRGTHQLYFDSLTALIFLLLSSRYYLARLRQSSHFSLGALDYFQHDYRGKIGDIERLTPGVQIAFDGVVRTGEGWCDHSQFTGESDPVKIQVGDLVYAGTIFIDSSSSITVEVVKVGQETRLAQLLKKVSEAQSRRTPTELSADQWAKRLLMVVVALACVSFYYFFTQNIMEEGVRRILALLIVTCPCALALATPLVFTLAMKSLLKKGLLVKDPACLDRLPEVKEIYFDKTGTLTEGRMTAEFNPEGLSTQDRAALYSLVRKSRHPVSRAIEKRLQDHSTENTLQTWNHFEEKIGVGLFADSYSLCKAEDHPFSKTTVRFSLSGKKLVDIPLQDQVRDDSLACIQTLQAHGFEVGILSGDHLGAVSALARQLGVDTFLSNASPEAKSEEVLGQMMVGDGVNDALALSNAQVSIAVQGGMEAAIQSAQVYSRKPGISLIPALIATSFRVRKTLRQNFVLSTTYNLVGAGLSLTGHMSPLVAAVLMPLSALTVFASSLSRMRGDPSWE